MEDKRHLQNKVQQKGYGYSMGKKQGYIITTKCLRLRCRHPEWLSETQDFYNQIQKFYYDLFLEHSELREENSQVCLREMERLKYPGTGWKRSTKSASVGKGAALFSEGQQPMQGLWRQRAICRDWKMAMPGKQRVFIRRSRTIKECTGILNPVKSRFASGMEANEMDAVQTLRKSISGRGAADVAIRLSWIRSMRCYMFR